MQEFKLLLPDIILLKAALDAGLVYCAISKAIDQDFTHAIMTVSMFPNIDIARNAEILTCASLLELVQQYGDK